MGVHLQKEKGGESQHPPGVLIEKEAEVGLHKDRREAEREKGQEETKESVGSKKSAQDQDASQGKRQRGHQRTRLQEILWEAGHDFQLSLVQGGKLGLSRTTLITG